VLAERTVSCTRGATVWTESGGEDHISRQSLAGRSRGPARERGSRTVRESLHGDISIYLVQIDSGRVMRVTLPNVTARCLAPIAREESVWASPGTGATRWS